MSLRVGTVPYVVSWPLLEGLDEDGITVVERVPALLIEDLRGGRIDVALASAIELFRTPGTTAIPGVGIVALREVLSVCLFSRLPFEEIRSVALDPASRAAAALTRILIEERGGECTFHEVPRGQDLAHVDTDAFLLIGDPALRLVDRSGSKETGHVQILDLATLWRERTGLPFTFAVWLVAPGRDLGELPSHLQRAAHRGRSLLPRLIDRAVERTGVSRALMQRYLTEVCSYDLDAPGVLEGLALYGRRACEIGLAEGPAEVRLYRG